MVGRLAKARGLTPGNGSLIRSQAKRVAHFYVFHTWAPDSFETILDRWINAADKVAKLVAQLAGAAKDFKGKPTPE